MSALLRGLMPSVAPPPPIGAGTSPAARGPPRASSTDSVELVTLFSRIETSSVLDERRRSLRACADMLTATPIMAKSVTKTNLAMLMAVIERYRDHADMVTATLEILIAAVNVPSVSVDTIAPVLKAAIYIELIRDGSFWIKYNCVTLLTRLHALDPTGMSSQLLQTGNGVGHLIEILNDTSNGDALRDEGLVLFRELTGTHGNTELQSVLAFDNCFESLFSIVRNEGGIAASTVIVRDCIEIVQNMLRANKNTQKFFREMGHMKDLAQLIETDVSANGTQPVSDPSVIESLTLCVQTVSALLRAGDGTGEGAEVRNALFKFGVTSALTILVFSTMPVQRSEEASALETEGISTLAQCLSGAKAASEAFVGMTVQSQGSALPTIWCALRIALSDVFADRQVAGAVLLHNVLHTAGTPAAQVITKGLAPKTGSALACGALLGTYLFAPKKPNALTFYVACHLLSSAMARSVGLAEQILMTPWEGSATFCSAFVKYAVSQLETRQLTFPDMSAMLRVVLFALRTSPKALQCLISEDTRIIFFAEWACACRDGAHVPYLSASVVALAVAMCPDQLPAGCKLDQQTVRELLTKKISASKYTALREAVASTNEFATAPRGGALGELPKCLVYDGPLITLLYDIERSVAPLFESADRQAAPDAGRPHESEPKPESPLTKVADVSPVDHEKLTLQAAEIERLKAALASAEHRIAAAERNAAAAEQARIDAIATNSSQVAMAQQQLASADATRLRELYELRTNFDQQLRAKDKDLQELSAAFSLTEQKLRANAQVHDENERLQLRLDDLTRERDELLILVAELDEMCAASEQPSDCR